jgi:hypothetical protein
VVSKECGEALSVASGGRSLWWKLDGGRKGGEVKGNVVPCCKLCQLMGINIYMVEVTSE